MWAPDYPWGLTEAQYEQELARDLRIFGQRDQAVEAVRVLGRFDGDELQAALNLFRFGSSPGAIEALHRMNKEIDIRHVLSAVRVPTLICADRKTLSYLQRLLATSQVRSRRPEWSRFAAPAISRSAGIQRC
jgi:hypothetical protein